MADVNELSCADYLGVALADVNEFSCADYQFFSKSSDNSCKKVLGINWNVVTDEFVHNFDDIIAMVKRSHPTKKNILKLTASFFDPLGG